ncbi:hypothetical protein V2J09_000909 [Rumex salicifolius]
MATFVRTTNKAHVGNNPKLQGNGDREPYKKNSLFKKGKKRNTLLMTMMFKGFLKTLVLPEPKRPNEVGETKDAKYCPYHRIISHSIKDCYVLNDIIERMANNGEIGIEEEASKSHVASPNNISMEEIVEALPFYPSPPRMFETIVEANENEGIPTVSLPPMAIPVQFMIDVEVQIVWAYPDMPRDGPRQPTLYEIMTYSDIEDLFSNDDDDDFSDLEW